MNLCQSVYFEIRQFKKLLIIFREFQGLEKIFNKTLMNIGGRAIQRCVNCWVHDFVLRAEEKRDMYSMWMI